VATNFWNVEVASDKQNNTGSGVAGNHKPNPTSMSDVLKLDLPLEH
jgi:hypothetical protein